MLKNEHMAVTNIFLIRHGETQWNLEQRFQGSLNSPLTDKGRRQACDAAEAMKELHFDYVYSSPLSRAFDTACLLVAGRGQPVIVDEALREINLGPWEGVTRAEVEGNYPEEYEKFWRLSVDYGVAGAESFVSVQARMVGAIENIFKQYAGKNILLVSHAMSIMCALRHYKIGIPSSHGGELKNCSPMQLQRVDNHTAIVVEPCMA